MATNGVNGHSGNALCSLDDFLSTKFDYLVLGGGTCGCQIAGRLTEDPNITVGVLEAGENLMDDKQVSTPSLYPTLIGRKKYDWCFESVPQPNAGNKTYSMPRGKLLGGSSGINYLMYVRGSKGDYDAWESMGPNPGWGWDSLKPYFKKHQTLDMNEPHHADPQFMPIAGKEEFHGTDGPIHTSFNDWYSPFEKGKVLPISGGRLC